MATSPSTPPTSGAHVLFGFLNVATTTTTTLTNAIVMPAATRMIDCDE